MKKSLFLLLIIMNFCFVSFFHGLVTLFSISFLTLMLDLGGQCP